MQIRWTDLRGMADRFEGRDGQLRGHDERASDRFRGIG